MNVIRVNQNVRGCLKNKKIFHAIFAIRDLVLNRKNHRNQYLLHKMFDLPCEHLAGFSLHFNRWFGSLHWKFSGESFCSAVLLSEPSIFLLSGFETSQ